MNKKGLTANLYEVRVLPDTVRDLVNAIFEQKDLSRKEIIEMAEYLDKRYKTGPRFVPLNSERYGKIHKVE